MGSSWIVAQGFGLGLGMIIPIGAQNAFVLNQGILKQHHMTTASICFVCDVALIMIGVFGGGAVLASNTLLLNAVTVGGIVFLTVYGWQSVQSARNNSKAGEQIAESRARGRRAVILGTLAVTLLNPHVYLDTVVVLGSIGGQFAFEQRIAFALGTILASLVWFYGLSLGAARMSPVLSKPRIRLFIDLAVASMMFFVAARLAQQLIIRLSGGE